MAASASIDAYSEVFGDLYEAIEPPKGIEAGLNSEGEKAFCVAATLGTIEATIEIWSSRLMKSW